MLLGRRSPGHGLFGPEPLREELVASLLLSADHALMGGATSSSSRQIVEESGIRQQLPIGRFSTRNSSEVFFNHESSFAFLDTIHDVVHVEVLKLYPDATLPDFTSKINVGRWENLAL